MLGLWVRIPPGALMSVSCECRVLSGASALSVVQRSSIERGVSEFDRQASIMRKPWPTRVCCSMKIETP